MTLGKKLLLIGGIGTLLSLGFFLYALFGHKPLSSLDRPEAGSGDESTSLTVEIGEKRYDLEVTLKEIPYTEEETAALLQIAYEGLEALFLNGNSDLNHVTKDLSMPSTYPDSEVSIRWYLSSYKYISVDGSLDNVGLEEPVSVTVQASLSLSDQTLSWEKCIWVYPITDPDEEELLLLLSAKLKSDQEEGAALLELPKEFLGESLTWYEKMDDRWIFFLLLTLVALVAMVAGQKQEEEKARTEREKKLKLAYPDIVSRLSLYMRAGISTRKAWERIVESALAEGKAQEPAYEEMQTTLRQMQSGISEALAYERFGSRCRISPYLKLGALLSQNLRRGTRNLSELLAEESREAFEDRKAYAKKLGEECESKLLFPMLLMLLTILVMVMYPALLSFQM